MFLHFGLLVLGCTASVTAAEEISNMNKGGEYLIANDKEGTAVKFNTSYASKKDAEYFDVYAGPVSTRYGEVFWQGLPAVRLPQDIIDRFDNDTIAIIGYEQDQVIKSENGTEDVPVSITDAYNHHYVAWLKGKHATMVEVDEYSSKETQKIMGHPLLMQAYAIDDPNPDSIIPTSQFFSEGNGGESRKSYHGYPKGMAQLLDSPTEFIMTPMQIDTWNRNTSLSSQFVPGPESPQSQAPPNAIYSGHLECPCTDRVIKQINHTYGTQTNGECPNHVDSAEDCFTSAAQFVPNFSTCSNLNVSLNSIQCEGMTITSATSADECRKTCCDSNCQTWLFGNGTNGAHGCYISSGPCNKMSTDGRGWNGQTRSSVTVQTNNQTISNTILPPGCTIMSDKENGTTVYYNDNFQSSAQCGAASGNIKLYGQSTSLVTFGVELFNEQARITLSGPNGVWFGVGLGAQQMSDTPNAIIVTGNGTVFEQKLANQQAGSRLALSVKILSNDVDAGIRTVILTRPMKGETPDHFTFNISDSSIDFINAIGKSSEFAYHKSRASATLSLKVEGAPTCVCDTGSKGYIITDMNPEPQLFSKDCLPEPYADLLQNHNPSCHIDTYAGGLHCCKSGNILLSKNQNPWPNNKLVYYMKWRFWYQNYTSATTTQQASHQNLVRFFRETEAHSGEYDVVKAPADTPPEDTIYQITAHFQVMDGVAMCNVRTSPHCAGPSKSGITLMYASGHCHAPSCIKMELWNADTGELICRQTPAYGTSTSATKSNPYDEIGYIAIPPCLYGSEEEGLYAPHYLSYATNLTSIKWNNNTYGHYGEMAMWQMRGYQSYNASDKFEVRF